ncbi:2-dehydro-3-deoxy-6-phosphogalactonate aldolase [Rhodoferax aquaticus]|uniref:2-dehydro-3-deoxy-6-phosphogalactonate aldolase n=1 Tax=Rhodoferax aquaticus TaxID=2527691 RepID=A0A515EU60_9BURK|nr:2-dehydro-3-deoxy-6-phosphogalactonate aldolase [Rhodoferax aquaticus]QDL56189.1 2-dehydro-3-deoxy-6-phosphogalactonate aldolase [Rhodoferax aquaticus]
MTPTDITPAHRLVANARTMPLVAILRGLTPETAVDIGHALVNAGFRTLEVPLNRPGALRCIELLVQHLPADTLVGGGTMLTPSDVQAVYDAGGRLMVSPNCAPAVIRHAVGLGMLCAPGVATPTEAFAALEAGAHALKLFPAEMVGHGGLKALKSVLPAGTDLWPVGGITPESMGAWRAAGATGFGIGGQLFSPGSQAADVGVRAAAYVQAWQALTAA